ncbi:MAG: diaminopimelate decarboxylase [Alphaproteobacteria bacterium]|jgi:diaminopimelate decarboxylase|nr:diaminopimelate decarboxylase [Alphaproteobacteria bacterium]
MFSLHSDLGYSTTSKGHLALHGVDLTSLASESPLYVMNETLIRANIRSYKTALQQHYPKPAMIFYASKAFLNLSMAHLVEQEGIGLDVCSEGELYIAKSAGFPMDCILLHGNNKTNSELQEAIRLAIHTIVVDSADEFINVVKIAKTEGKIPGVMLRVNPQIRVDTHPSIATGVRGSKFGLPIENPQTQELVHQMNKSPSVRFQGLHCHIGSQVLDFQCFTDALQELVSYIKRLHDQGVTIESLNIGGGLGVKDTLPAAQIIEQWVVHVCETLKRLYDEVNLPLPELMIEPGRSIVSETGCTLYRIGRIKEGEKATFLAVHGGMSDNIRPALLGAHYLAIVANRLGQPFHSKAYKVVGNCCESGDVLIPEIYLPECHEGDVLALLHTGAYSYSLANQYNKHTLPGMIFVREGGSYDWVTRPQPLDQLILNDVVPSHLAQNHS